MRIRLEMEDFISRILPENRAADIRSSILMVLPIWMIFLTNCLEKKVDSTEPEVLEEEADLEVLENLAVVLAEYMRKEGKISRRKYRSALKKRYLAVGRAVGREEGREEGRAAGMAEEKIATAKRLLAMGLNTSQVAQGAGLSMEEVEKLL